MGKYGFGSENVAQNVVYSGVEFGYDVVDVVAYELGSLLRLFHILMSEKVKSARLPPALSYLVNMLSILFRWLGRFTVSY